MKSISLHKNAFGATVVSSILSIGTALRAALSKAKPPEPAYSINEIVQMDSPRMQRALQLVSMINNCKDEVDIKTVEYLIQRFEKDYPEPNPLMAFLRHKAWDVMACAHINAQNLKAMRTKGEISNTVKEILAIRSK